MKRYLKGDDVPLTIYSAYVCPRVEGMHTLYPNPPSPGDGKAGRALGAGLGQGAKNPQKPRKSPKTGGLSLS